MNLDDTDRRLLYLLQQEMPTDLTHEELAERTDVSSSTVSNRLQRLREAGVLQDYQPQINYELAGIPHRILLVCTAPIAERETFAERAIDVDGVVTVRELMTGSRNLHVELVGASTRAVDRTVERLASFGLEIERSRILRREYSSACEHFGGAAATDPEE